MELLKDRLKYGAELQDVQRTVKTSIICSVYRGSIRYITPIHPRYVGGLTFIFPIVDIAVTIALDSYNTHVYKLKKIVETINIGCSVVQLTERKQIYSKGNKNNCY